MERKRGLMTKKQLEFCRDIIAPLAATAAALVWIWWSIVYTVLSFNSIVGATIMVYLYVLWRVGMVFERQLEARKRAARKRAERRKA